MTAILSHFASGQPTLPIQASTDANGLFRSLERFCWLNLTFGSSAEGERNVPALVNQAPRGDDERKTGSDDPDWDPERPA